MSGAAPATDKSESLWTDARRRLLKDKLAVFAFVTIVVYVLIAIVSYVPSVFQDVDATNPEFAHNAPTAANWFGTNTFGQDVMARVARGTGIALQVGFFAGVIAVLIGALLGAAAGWFGGWVDDVITWLYSTIASIPGILLIIGLGYMLKEFGETMAFAAVFIAMGLTYWVGVCRLVRAEVMKLKDRDYVLAARAMGFGNRRIVLQHVMPNVMHLLIVSFTLLFVQAIKAEVVVSFLGVGVVGMPSWGLLIKEATTELTKGYWWQMTFTSVALFGIVLAFQVFGDALRDALDPRLRH